VDWGGCWKRCRQPEKRACHCEERSDAAISMSVRNHIEIAALRSQRQPVGYALMCLWKNAAAGS
jgi:hypothetical protein